MCLAIPAKVVAIEEDGETAIVAVGEVRKMVSLALVEGIRIDDYVLVHVGYALNKVSQDEAERTLALFAQAGMTP
ncbi:MAG: HypC/HybG/HupF family hydrogenase formation chaperone [Gammaproteobacteria bacterium]|nr:HypC/HybG/HupF family hydrogenase formation chaperone [Gammaproteobacteria bacterium]